MVSRVSPLHLHGKSRDGVLSQPVWGPKERSNSFLSDSRRRLFNGASILLTPATNVGRPSLNVWHLFASRPFKNWNEHIVYPFGRKKFWNINSVHCRFIVFAFLASIAGVYTVGCLPCVRPVNLLWFYRDSFVEVCESTFLPRKKSYEKLLFRGKKLSSWQFSPLCFMVLYSVILSKLSSLCKRSVLL